VNRTISAGNELDDSFGELDRPTVDRVVLRSLHRRSFDRFEEQRVRVAEHEWATAEYEVENLGSVARSEPRSLAPFDDELEAWGRGNSVQRRARNHT